MGRWLNYSIVKWGHQPFCMDWYGCANLRTQCTQIQMLLQSKFLPYIIYILTICVAVCSSIYILGWPFCLNKWVKGWFLGSYILYFAFCLSWYQLTMLCQSQGPACLLLLTNGGSGQTASRVVTIPCTWTSQSGTKAYKRKWRHWWKTTVSTRTTINRYKHSKCKRSAWLYLFYIVSVKGIPWQ